MANRPILLVGSIPRDNSKDVFDLLADKLGDRAWFYPDGETGPRIQWVRWQRHVFDDNPQLYLSTAAKAIAGVQDKLVRPFYALKAGTDIAAFAFKPLGYAKEAIRSYEIFARLKKQGDIPASVRFQMCLPTAASLLSVFVEMGDRAAVEPAMEAAMKREIDEVAAAIPAAELAVQWDIVSEVIGQDGGAELYFGDIFENAVARLVRHAGFIPDGVAAGLHFCYGDPGHKHVIEPMDLRTCVRLANAVGAAVSRPLTWIHMPVPRDRDDEAYFVPLRELATPPATEIFLGLVHYSDGIDGTTRRIAAAKRFRDGFGIATECGFGRRDPATVAALLDIHVAASGL